MDSESPRPDEKSPHYKMYRDIEAPANPDEKVFVKDKARLKEKLRIIKQDGPEKLCVFADFDATLTRKELAGKKVDHSFRVLENVFHASKS